MTKRTKGILYITGVLLFVLYLLFSNQIVVNLDHTNSRVERADLSELSSNAKVLCNVYDITESQGQLECVTIKGLAACPTMGDNSKRKVTLLLMGEKQNYRVNTTLEFSGGDLTVYGHELQGDLNNFITIFPTVHLKNGIYQLGLHVWENEETQGFINLGTKLEKDNTGFHTYFPPQVDEIRADDFSAYTILNLDVAGDFTDEGNFIFSGRAARPDVESEYSDIYVNIIFEDGTTKSYGANVRTDAWFNTYFETDIYTFSSFTAEIPREDVEGKSVSVEVLVDNDGICGSGDQYNQFSFADGKCEPTYENAIDSPDISTDLFVDSINSWNGLAATNEDCYFFNGVAYTPEIPMQDPQFYLQFKYADGTIDTFPTRVGRNSWMEENVGKNYAMSAYQTKIALEDIREENVDMYIVIQNGGKAYRTEMPISYRWQADHFVEAAA